MMGACEIGNPTSAAAMAAHGTMVDAAVHLKKCVNSLNAARTAYMQGRRHIKTVYQLDPLICLVPGDGCWEGVRAGTLGRRYSWLHCRDLVCAAVEDYRNACNDYYKAITEQVTAPLWQECTPQ